MLHFYTPKYMRNLILKTHKFFYRPNARHRYKFHNKPLWLVCNAGFRLAQLLLMGYLELYKHFNLYPKPLRRDNDIVVSLTSFPARINKVWMVVDSIFHQTFLPSEVRLYLSDEEFPQGKASLPKRLLDYEKIGLKICLRPGRLMPHTKYYFALQECADKCVVTVDDDIYYHHDTIERLYNLHLSYPTCICANTLDIIALNEDGSFKSTSEWKRTQEPMPPSLRNCALGYDGVLYPPHAFRTKQVFDQERIKRLCLRADDMWLKMHEIIEDIPAVCGEYYTTGPSILGSQVIALMYTNCSQTNPINNDTQWLAMCKEYGVSNGKQL